LQVGDGGLGLGVGGLGLQQRLGGFQLPLEGLGPFLFSGGGGGDAKGEAQTQPYAVGVRIQVFSVFLLIAVISVECQRGKGAGAGDPRLGPGHRLLGSGQVQRQMPLQVGLLGDRGEAGKGDGFRIQRGQFGQFLAP